ncbi:MAG: PilZ domain-containing protein [Planctomycetaceae bacterium]|nr:PilZ domain-containing protein [Planctomycetaceae bacterium]
MPRCGSCGKNYDDSRVMELVRNQDNRWISICRNCLDIGVDVNLVEQANIAVEDQALATADKPSIDVTLSTDPIANARKLLDSLRNLRQSKERVGRARGHERKQVEMRVHFTLARDDTRHEGTVKDFSQGGLRVVTSYPLVRGQTVQFDWNIPLPPAMMRMLQSSAEVRRVIRNDDGLYDVGFKFVSRQSDKGANRRRYRRYKCDMVVYYQRNGSELQSWGKVIDISQGGCQMQLDEKLEKGEVFTVRLIGGGGTRGDLVGSMRVCRVIQREVSFETGCAFEKMRMEQQGHPHPAV